MARSLRIQYEVVYYHVMNRGGRRENIFYTEKHKNLFLELLDDILIFC